MAFQLGSTRIGVVAFAVTLLAAFLAESAKAEDWPCWRGPHRDGISREVDLLGDRVYTLGATRTLLCLEAKTGKKVWQQDLLKIAGTNVPTHGYCGSPLVVCDHVYPSLGGTNGKSIGALDKKVKCAPGAGLVC
jgi:hypothetical protein